MIKKYREHAVHRNFLLFSNITLNFISSFERLMYLLYLDLASNQITQLPCTIINLPYLAELDLTDNAIWELPEDFGRLKYSLRSLNVSGNKIEKLPESIGTLARCEVMDFSRNQIFELPVSLKGCVKLQRLNVSQNIIEYCDVLIDMSSLEKVDFSSNRIANFPEAYLGNNLISLRARDDYLSHISFSANDRSYV